MQNSKIRRFSLISIALASMVLIGCGNNPSETSSSTEKPNDSTISETAPDTTPTEPSSPSDTEAPEKIYTIAEAIEKANEAGETESEPIMVKGTIKSITNYAYGEMYLTDGTNELYIFGVRGQDNTYFDKLDYIPMVGDTITLKGGVHVYKNKPEMKQGNLIDVEKTHEVPSADDYQVSTIDEARKAAVGTKVKLTGVVAKTTLTQKKNPNGFLLVDNTNSIFIYGGASAVQVKEGNTVTVVGEIDHFISSSEADYAEQIGYQGSIQVTKSYILENDKGTTNYNTSWMEEKSIKDIINTDVKTENITGKIYKTQGTIERVEGSSFVNYYINDFDGTGSYVYSSNSGSDFAYLDDYLNVPVALDLTVINYKCTASGAIARFVPVKVEIIEDFKYPEEQVAPFALKYAALPQFETEYAGDPEKELIDTYENTILGIKDVQISYASSNEDLAYFEKSAENKTIFHINPVKDQKATITITVNYLTYTSSDTIEVSYVDVSEGAVNVSTAIASADETEVKVKGIVGGKTLNKIGFYLIDETGAVAVQLSSEDELKTVHTGDAVVITGKKTHITNKPGEITGQLVITNSTVNGVLSVDNTIPETSYVTDKSFADLLNIQETEDATARIYTVSAYAYKTEGSYAQLYFYENEEASKDENSKFLSVYSSNPSQYEFAEPMVNKQVTLTFAFVNWNNKTYYKICPLALSDGNTTVYNSL